MPGVFGVNLTAEPCIGMEDFIEDENVRSLGSGQHIASLLNVIGMACHTAHREQSHFEIEQYRTQFLL
jgi:hypothetical protein